MKPSLYYPIQPFVVNQAFGADVAYYQKMFGVNGHNGLDLKALHGQPIYAAHDGIANYEIDTSGGHGVVVTADEYKTIYWHMVDSSIEPQFTSPIEGKIVAVKAGDLIGYADSTGVSSGNHLHFGFKFIDANGATLNTNNGFLGAVDPTPYLNGLYFNEIGQTKTYNFQVNLKAGDKNDDVKYLQSFLVDKGYLNASSVTGFYGPLTRNAVYKMQIDNQIPLGLDWLYLGFYFGPKTREFLNKKYT